MELRLQQLYSRLLSLLQSKQSSVLGLNGAWPAQHMARANLCPLTQGPQSLQGYSTKRDEQL